MLYNVYLIRFNNNGLLMKVVILADDYEEAEKILRKRYRKFDIEIDIEEYEEIEDKGVVLTWNEPIN